jgi:hypothetical protein
MGTLEEGSQSAENVIHNKPKRSTTSSITKEGMPRMFYMVILLFSQDLHGYEYFVLDYKCVEYELRVLEKIIATPSNGEEKLVYYPEIASINRKLLDCLFNKSGKEAYLNDEVTIQKKTISTIQN